MHERADTTKPEHSASLRRPPSTFVGAGTDPLSFAENTTPLLEWQAFPTAITVPETPRCPFRAEGSGPT